ncbi:MAG: hypothetical protein WC679_02155 [Bacteroidales bacterium]|jgi:hypothetical protein
MKMSKKELISEGFLPSAARAKMSIPFRPVETCHEDTWSKLPKTVQKLYTRDLTHSWLFNRI